MVFVISLFGAIFWVAFVLFIFYLKQRPEAQVRRRLYLLIHEAEMERARAAAKTKEISEVEEIKNEKKADQTFLYRKILSPMFDFFGESFQKFVPPQIKLALEEKVFQAGKSGRWSIPRIVSFWFVSMLIGTLVAVGVTQAVEFHFLQEFLIILAGIICGAIFPLARLNRLIAERQKEIRRALPEFLDLLCVSVQAGLTFNGAISKITSKMDGALIDELKRFQSDVSLGMTHQYALTQMARRCNLEEMYLFTSSVIQAEKLGTSMGRTLKIQADNMRDRHRQFVKSEALKAPVKIIFPMVFFIFPSIFVVVLFPAILSLIKNMSR